MESRLNELREAEDRLKRAKMSLHTETEDMKQKAAAVFSEMTALAKNPSVTNADAARFALLQKEYFEMYQTLALMGTHIPYTDSFDESWKIKRTAEKNEDEAKIELRRISDPAFREFETKLASRPKSRLFVRDDVVRAFSAHFDLDDDAIKKRMEELIVACMDQYYDDETASVVIKQYKLAVELVEEMICIRK